MYRHADDMLHHHIYIICNTQPMNGMACVLLDFKLLVTFYLQGAVIDCNRPYILCAFISALFILRLNWKASFL